MDENLTLPRLLLASGSPRRLQLLRSAGWNPVVQSVGLHERRQPDEQPAEMVMRLAREKVEQAAANPGEAALVLAADTIVVDGDNVLGKPDGADSAMAMLMDLADRPHAVLTALALYDLRHAKLSMKLTRSELVMRAYSHAQAAAYVAGGSPLDKAGAYGIQDDDFNPVDLDALKDCFANVMGLPLCTLGSMVAELGYERAAAMSLVNRCRALHPGQHPQVAI